MVKNVTPSEKCHISGWQELPAFEVPAILDSNGGTGLAEPVLGHGVKWGGLEDHDLRG